MVLAAIFLTQSVSDPGGLGACLRTCRLVAPICRQRAGQAYCDALSAARTDDYQVNDFTVVRSTQRVLQIDDVACTLAVDRND